MTKDLHHSQLSKFLRNCRARLTPGDVGLPDTGRRRTPGLRREDVAVLAGVSVTWYTWLEQGRGVRASDRVLERLSSTLRLSADERDYLFSLVQNHPAPLAPSRNSEIAPSVLRTVHALNVPAIVMTIKWDVLAWNAMTRVLRNYDSMAPGQRNLIKLILDDPVYRSDPVEYEAIVRRVLAKLRVDYSQCAGDPTFEAFIEEMIETNAVVRRLWSSPEISTRSEGVHTSQHSVYGPITFEHSSYIIEGAPNLRMVIFVPHGPEDARKLERFAGDMAEQSRVSGRSARKPTPARSRSQIN